MNRSSWCVLLIALLLCSCRSVSSPAVARRSMPSSTSVNEPAASAPVVAAAQATPAAAQPIPAAAPSSASLADASERSPIQQVAYTPPALPSDAWTGGPASPPPGSYPPASCPPGTPGESQRVVYPNPWTPDGLKCPWPSDEYIFDGGDRLIQATVARDWTVRGLDNEDTIVHYDTRDGKTIVKPSNCVPIYAPRFAAVRKVYGIELHEGREHIAGVEKPIRINSQDTSLLATTAIQPQQPILQHGIKTSVRLRERLRGVGVEAALLPRGVESGFLPHEDFLLIKRGEYDLSEKARLTSRIQAAYQWAKDQSVQVTIEGQLAHEGKGNNKAAETLMYELPPGKPCLRIVKVASKSEAQVGDTIDFTIRFDNMGDQKIGNVTIIDSLTTRLEYVPDSAQCTQKANFATVENEAESLVLRWEIQEPMRVGEGGIIRFKCKVR